ncbi:hypothetical protein ACROYT_G014078 [Oculina patagonica]
MSTTSCMPWRQLEAIPVSLYNTTTSKKPKAERGLSKLGSQFVMKETGIFLPVGTEHLYWRCTSGSKYASVSVLSFQRPDARGSLYCPSDTSVDITTDSHSRGPTRKESTPLTKLNKFSESRDVSPVRHTVTIPWNEASERTRRRHLRKAQQAVGADLDEVAPNQPGELWHSLVPSFNKQFSSDSESEDEDVDNVLMNVLTEGYSNASTWDTRRQILSIMADKATF